jgi:hypothetical protein
VCAYSYLREFAFAEIHLRVLLHEPETEEQRQEKVIKNMCHNKCGQMDEKLA